MFSSHLLAGPVSLPLLPCYGSIAPKNLIMPATECIDCRKKRSASGVLDNDTEDKFGSYTIRPASNLFHFMLLASQAADLVVTYVQTTEARVILADLSTPDTPCPTFAHFLINQSPRANYLDTYKYHRKRIYVALLVDDATCPTTWQTGFEQRKEDRYARQLEFDWPKSLFYVCVVERVRS